ncbi:putative GNAT domain-containing protein [Helianthus annuus]|nr:putative GNAT domain-containing protein [Helianthus annuus]KAJ0472050.1 putative GNAT domain-containing protein [Helianthus annuus]KAJ0651520.1 putative GNAT domain-containing protein [Helianthus annuus]
MCNMGFVALAHKIGHVAATVCIQGKLSKASVRKVLVLVGHQPSRCQNPWNFGERFQDKDFPSLSGARIVSIATHPNAMKHGYGSAAIELLAR